MKTIKFTVVVMMLSLLLGALTAQAAIYVGVGVDVDVQNGRLIVYRLVEDGPADAAGVKVNDIITAIDGQAVIGSNAWRISENLFGQKGVTVTLTISRSAIAQPITIPVVRAEINEGQAVWTCPQEPIRGFGKVWQEHREARQRLGCTFTNGRRGEHATRAAVQTFEHGWMLWLETDTVANVDPIYVFYADNGSYVRFGDQLLVDAHQYAPTEPGFYKVGDRFAKVYWERISATDRTRLGRATNESVDSLGAFQEFWNGRMFWAGKADTIYVIYNGRYDLDGDDQWVYSQGWLSYKDTFEE